MSLRLVLFSDTHLGFDYPVRGRRQANATNRRGEDFFRNFESILAYAQQERPDVLVHCGDLFHRSEPHAAVVDRAYASLLACADAGVPILIVPGNHERSVLPPSLFLQHSNIRVFDRARVFAMETKSGHSLAVGGFPYELRVGETFGGLAATLEHEMAGHQPHHRLLCFHHAVAGCAVGAGSGTQDYVFRSGADVIPSSAIPSGFDLVMSGHIHRAQCLPLASPVLYSGSTERTSFAEWRETKSFCDVRIASPGEKPQITRVPLPSRSMHPVDARSCHNARMLETCIAASLSGEIHRPIVRAQVPAYLKAAQVRRIEQNLGCTLKLVVSRVRATETIGLD